MHGDCGCGPDWRKPKPNGTCATCGGWLPGQADDTPWGREGMTLTQMWAGKSPTTLLEPTSLEQEQ